MKKTIYLLLLVNIILFSILFSKDRTTTIPIYEYYSKKSKTYAYSSTGEISSYEKWTDSIYKWKKKDIVFYAFEDQVYGSVPVYQYAYNHERFYSTNKNNYGTSSYKNEGIVFYAFENSISEESHPIHYCNSVPYGQFRYHSEKDLGKRWEIASDPNELNKKTPKAVFWAFLKPVDIDCAGEINGSASFDACNICSGGISNHKSNSDKDCHGTCFGTAILTEECGCDGGKTGLKYYHCLSIIDINKIISSLKIEIDSLGINIDKQFSDPIFKYRDMFEYDYEYWDRMIEALPKYNKIFESINKNNKREKLNSLLNMTFETENIEIELLKYDSDKGKYHMNVVHMDHLKENFEFLLDIPRENAKKIKENWESIDKKGILVFNRNDEISLDKIVITDLENNSYEYYKKFKFTITRPWLTEQNISGTIINPYLGTGHPDYTQTYFESAKTPPIILSSILDPGGKFLITKSKGGLNDGVFIYSLINNKVFHISDESKGRLSTDGLWYIADFDNWSVFKISGLLNRESSYPDIEKDLFIKPNYSLSPFDRFMPGGSTIKTRFSRNKSAKNDDIIFPKRYKDDSDKIVFGVSGGAHSNLLSKELTKLILYSKNNIFLLDIHSYPKKIDSIIEEGKKKGQYKLPDLSDGNYQKLSIEYQHLSYEMHEDKLIIVSDKNIYIKNVDDKKAEFSLFDEKNWEEEKELFSGVLTISNDGKYLGAVRESNGRGKKLGNPEHYYEIYIFDLINYEIIDNIMIYTTIDKYFEKNIEINNIHIGPDNRFVYLCGYFGLEGNKYQNVNYSNDMMPPNIHVYRIAY